MTRTIRLFIVCALALLGVLFLPTHTVVSSHSDRIVGPLAYTFATQAIFGSGIAIDFAILASEVVALAIAIWLLLYRSSSR